MLTRLLDFSRALRDAGVPVSVSENLDSLEALEHVPITERPAFRAALATTLIKSDAYMPAFDALFDLYFSGGTAEDWLLTGTDEGHEGADPAEQHAAGAREAAEDFRAELTALLDRGDDAALEDAARRAVDLFGRVPNSPSGTLFYQYPVLRALDLEGLLRRLLQDADDSMDGALQGLGYRRGIRDFRRAVEREVNRRAAIQNGPREVTRYAVRPLPEDLDLGTASAADMAELRRAVHPLARKLATRVAMKRRRASRGGIDMRRTVRHSLSTGGAPFELAFKHRPPHRPELFVLCDVSSSVASFSRFSLMLVHALSAQFSRVRSFVFIDTLDEVTKMFEHEDILKAVEKMSKEATVATFDGRTNYAASLKTFLDRYGAALSPKATVFILGDARNNYRPARDEPLQEVKRRAHKVFWLNPEPRPQWDSGDSLAATYARHTDGMVEVRTLRQLEDFIARIL